MKKMVTLLITMLLLGLIFTGCSKDEEHSEAILNTNIEDKDKEDESGEDGGKDNIVAKETEEDTEEEIDPLIIEEIVTEVEMVFGDIDKDAIIEYYDDLDFDLDEDIDAQSDAEIMKALGDMLKYKVSDIDVENFEGGLYDLSYFSDEYYDEVGVHFVLLLYGTAEFVTKPLPAELGIGGGVKGTLFGKKTVIEVSWNEEMQETYVVISSF